MYSGFVLLYQYQLCSAPRRWTPWWFLVLEFENLMYLGNLRNFMRKRGTKKINVCYVCAVFLGSGHWAPHRLRKVIPVREVSRWSQDVVGRGCKAKLHLPVFMVNMEEGSCLARVAQMRDISLHDKCREWLNQKKQQTPSYLQLLTLMFLFKVIQEDEKKSLFPSGMKGKGRKQTSVGWRWK